MHGARYFDGLNDQINLTYANLTNGLTYSMWVKLDDYKTPDLLAFMETIVSIEGDPQFLNWYPDATQPAETQVYTFNLNTWYHIAVTHAANESYKLFVKTQDVQRTKVRFPSKFLQNYFSRYTYRMVTRDIYRNFDIS